MLDAICTKYGDSSTMKCVLFGLFGADSSFSPATMRRASVIISPVPQGSDVAFEVAGDKRLPASLLLPQHFPQVFRLIGLGLIPQERPQLGVRAAVKILRGGLFLVSLFIVQNEIVRFYRLGYDVPEMLLIVQLIEIPTDFPAHFSGQLHGIGKNIVAGLLPIKFPCVVLSGVLQEYVTFPETVRP